MASVGVRDLKNRLSHFLRLVGRGDRITVTDRGRPVAVIVPPEENDEVARAMAMVKEGLAHWGGGKPRGSARPVKVRGKPISQTVLDERR
jgi:prevent-host-death family protein